MEHEHNPDAATAPRPRRRRGRTALLIAAALALGTLAGTATGYAIQYDRDPTPLPPLAQRKLPAPKALAPDDATTAKTINANRWHKTDGDLSKLLIEAPSGAQVLATGYEPLDSFATTFERPDSALRDFMEHCRRIAATTWLQGDILVEVRLVQFRDLAGANDFQKGQFSYMPGKEYAGNNGVAVPGVPADLAHVWVYSEPHQEPGYLPVRQAKAIARRGDIALEMFYTDKRGRSIAEGDVVDLAKRQLERL